MRKYKNNVEETTQNKNKTQFKFKSINPIHQTNENRILTITTNDFQCESSLKLKKKWWNRSEKMKKNAEFKLYSTDIHMISRAKMKFLLKYSLHKKYN